MVARCIGYLFEWDNGCESSNRHQPFVVTCSAQVITHSLLARAGDNPVRVARWVAGFIGGVDVEAKNVQCKIRWDMVVIGLVVEVIFHSYIGAIWRFVVDFPRWTFSRFASILLYPCMKVYRSDMFIAMFCLSIVGGQWLLYSNNGEMLKSTTRESGREMVRISSRVNARLDAAFISRSCGTVAIDAIDELVFHQQQQQQ